MRLTRHLLSDLFALFTQFEERKVLIRNTCLILVVTYGAVSRSRGFLGEVDSETSRL